MLEQHAADPASGPVKSAQRVIDIFELYARSKVPATLSAVASALAMPKSSCLALLKTLELNGYLYEVRPQIGYYPTRRWLDRAQVIAAHDPLIETIRPAMDDLRDRTGETVILGKPAGGRVMYIEVVESAETLRYTAVAGQFKPLHGTASGKAILAAMAEEERAAAIAGLVLAPLTPRTLTDPAALAHDIAQGIARGWQISRGENVADATAIASAMRLGGAVYVLVVAGPTPRIDARIAAIGDALAAACRTIERG